MVHLNKNAQQVLESRYLRRNATGNLIETPEALFRRVAKSVASAELQWGTAQDAEKWEEVFFQILSHLLFLPNSPTLMNAGTLLNQLSACFVLPVEDSLEGIFTTLKQAALIQQSGGGTGFNFSHLRPKDDLISLTGGKAAGPVSFMKVFDVATEHVKQGGKRRGANMGTLNIDHPDIEEFIFAKRQEDALNNFNISVGISDAFMGAVENNNTWELVHPNTQQVVKSVLAKDLWNDIVENAWLNGEPGLIFLDTINVQNPLISLGKIESTNPCGEVPLLPYEACNLGSINLSAFAAQDATLNWQQLEVAIEAAIRFLDNVIEVNSYLLPETKLIVQGNRKIGLGVMGWADLLIMLQIPYDSDEAIHLAHKLMHFIQQKSRTVSASLAKERGTFPNWKYSTYYPHMPLRNATLLSIAPTGTIAVIAGASSSIEPLFALAYRRQHVLNGATLNEINPYFLTYLQRNNLYVPSLIEEVKETGSLQAVKGIPEKVKHLFKTALDIKPERHLQHQVVFGKYVDNAVSKTINLPQTATLQETDNIYKLAWQSKAKGITVFRYHSRSSQVLEQGISRADKACKACVS